MDDANDVEVEVEVVQDIRRPALCMLGEYRSSQMLHYTKVIG
jgi:hypothetical protein